MVIIHWKSELTFLDLLFLLFIWCYAFIYKFCIREELKTHFTPYHMNQIIQWSSDVLFDLMTWFLHNFALALSDLVREWRIKWFLSSNPGDQLKNLIIVKASSQGYQPFSEVKFKCNLCKHEFIQQEYLNTHMVWIMELES